MNVERTNSQMAAENVLKEIRQILGVPEGASLIVRGRRLIEHVKKQQARITELEEFIETIDHQYEAMQQIRAWCEAYPVDIFTPPDWVEAKEKLGSELLTRVSADNMRHVVDGIRNIITQCEKNSSQ